MLPHNGESKLILTQNGAPIKEEVILTLMPTKGYTYLNKTSAERSFGKYLKKGVFCCMSGKSFYQKEFEWFFVVEINIRSKKNGFNTVLTMPIKIIFQTI